ncbi:MAG TPA: hypothetical protein VEJ46_05965 [Candidatus Acidoferrum sp.]|nr:hypothetical protein [Candidatus Acidoferrum sp.]
MNVAVSYDEEGNILTLFDPEALSTDAGFFTYIPAIGEQHCLFDLPGGLEGTPFTELPYLLHVNISGQRPRLERKAAPANLRLDSPSVPRRQRESSAFNRPADQ